MFEKILFVGKGLYITLPLWFGGLLIGVILGTILGVVRYRYPRYGAFFISVVISFLRGTPLLLQLSFMYFALPSMGIMLSTMSAGIVTFGINSSAYIAEVLRAGIESIPKGQFEAAQTLEIPSYYIWKDIILPQVFNNIFPALINEFIALLKETPLIGVICGMDLMRTAQILGAAEFTYFLPLCIAGVYYYVLVLVIEYIGKWAQRKYVKN